VSGNSGNSGDGEGTVYLAHAWCAEPGRRYTVGPWHWWNVYSNPETADMQAVRRARGWKTWGRCEVLAVVGSQAGGRARQVVQMVRRGDDDGEAQAE
jgi:hypothetical protein